MTLFDGRLLVRDFSDKGHLYALQDSREIVQEHPRRGHGAGAA
jgi:hypothetical protein